MKKITLTLITLLAIAGSVCAQSAGDYRSIASGNWNDATKWEMYDGSNWVAATTYPGQNSGSAFVSIMNATTIMLTASVPYPISFLFVSADPDQVMPAGSLVFSSESP